MNFIEWCNNNEGFLTMILTIISLIISVLTVIVSVRTAILPYKKKILINHFLIEKQENYICHLYIINAGNRTIGINSIAINYEDKLVGLSNFNSNNFIEPTKVFETDIIIKQSDICDFRQELKIRITDTEFDYYKFGIGLAMG